MRNTYFLIIYCLLNFLSVSAQDIHRESSNPSLNFQHFMSSVNVALVELPAALQQQVDEGSNVIVNQLTNYIYQMGIESVAITSHQKQQAFNSVASFCDIVRVSLEMKGSEQGFTQHQLKFISCLGDVFAFSAPNVVVGKGEATLQEFNKLWLQMFDGKVSYQNHLTLKLPKGKMTPYNEVGLDHRLANSTDPIEGKYEKKLASHTNKSSYRIGVIKNKTGGYDVVYLNGATNYKDWEEGELMGEIAPKGDKAYYRATWLKPNKAMQQNAFVSLDKNKMLILSFKDSDKTYEYFRIRSNEQATSDLVSASGTAFAISQSGHLLTSYHLVKKADRVDVELNGKKYSAIVVKEDPTNDLAIIKIEDRNFNGLAQIPYQLKTEKSDVGETVFTLGYPLSSTMGKEVKLADGIISSLSGYKGNLATYQVGMAVYGGNSGGPLFDQNGALIGIIKARHNDTETASYAIKARNAMNLIDILGPEVQLPNENKLAGLSLAAQTKIVRDFVFQVNVY